jgi:hypothetical protein
VRQTLKPIKKVCDVSFRPAKHREIAGVDQDVASRYLNLTVKLMGVAEEHQPGCGSSCRRSIPFWGWFHTLILGSCPKIGEDPDKLFSEDGAEPGDSEPRISRNRLVHKAYGSVPSNPKATKL